MRIIKKTAIGMLPFIAAAHLFAAGEENEQQSLPNLYYGSTNPMPVVHPGGIYAWSGIYPNGVYSPERAFFHANGCLAWGGLSQEKQSWSNSEKAFFYYDNGSKTWGGLHQSRQKWVSEDGKFYHSNGKLAWGGLDQSKQMWMTDNARFFHDSGVEAWDGIFGHPVYYNNGQIAWIGTPKSAIYDETGKFISVADYVNIQLGSGSWLHVSSDRQFELYLALGPGYALRVKNHRVCMDLYGAIFDITNDF